MGNLPRLPLEEVEVARQKRKSGGVEIFGVLNGEVVEDDDELKRPGTVSSEESFDIMRASEVVG